MKWTSRFLAGAIACIVLSCGGGTGTGNPSTPPVHASVQSAPLAGPNAAALDRSGRGLALLNRQLLGLFFGLQRSYAAVSSFATFKACNDTMLFLNEQGNAIDVGGTTTPAVGQGLLTFSPSSTNPMAIGTLAVTLKEVLSEIDITFAVAPSLCSGANYAVEFDDGVHGVIDITQNTAFKFKFPAGGTPISSDGQTLTLKFGDIVNGMVTLGAGLNNSSIQTVNVGQAQ